MTSARLTSGPMLLFLIPVRTVSEANMREHWAVKARRKRDHTQTSMLVARSQLAKAGVQASGWVPLTLANGGIRITMTRLGVRALDTDNLAGALKGVQDGIAKALGVDDGDPRLEWVYRQEKGSKRSFGVVVEIKAQAQSLAV